jgi:hypothetical protein
MRGAAGFTSSVKASRLLAALEFQNMHGAHLRVSCERESPKTPNLWLQRPHHGQIIAEYVLTYPFVDLVLYIASSFRSARHSRQDPIPHALCTMEI